MIPDLIDKQDTSEIIRDQIAAILKAEEINQRALAEAAGKDPEGWRFKIYLERSNPWADFMDATEPQPPVINVTLESCDYNQSWSVIGGQHVGTTAVFNIDCYGHGMSADEIASDGHVAGDKMGCLEAQRAARFARNVLASAHYTYLDMPRGVVHQRWVDGLTILQPALEGREMQQIVAARLPLHVRFNEIAPQHAGEIAEIIGVTIFRQATGEIHFQGEYE